ncbi:MAG: FtsX-like permease family protein [Candidatus Sericytochromatia bacterium]|nr:FtsX-like permease family protein [Candidatus Sericytochromatia bacterium]
MATLVTPVRGRRADFGVLRAIGDTRLQIAAIIVGEAAGMGVAGCLVGTGAGYALALLLIRVINKQSFGWTIHLLSPWPHIGTSVMLVMVTALLAGIYPGYAASRLPIAEAVRTE